MSDTDTETLDTDTASLDSSSYSDLPMLDHTNSGLCDLAERVWDIPHLRRLIVANCVYDISPRTVFMRAFLVLDKRTCQDVIHCRYAYCDFENFPFHLDESSERLSWYRNAVVVLDLDGAFPFAYKHNGLAGLAQYFPRLQHLSSNDYSIDRGDSSRTPLSASYILTMPVIHLALQADGRLSTVETDHHLPLDWDVKVVYSLHFKPIGVARKLTIARMVASEEFTLPQCLRLPLSSLMVDGTHDFDTWCKILQMRKSLGLEIEDLWMPVATTPAQVLLLAEAVGSSVVRLTTTVHVDSYEQALVDLEWDTLFPHLETLNLYIHINLATAPDFSENARYFSPAFGVAGGGPIDGSIPAATPIHLDFIRISILVDLGPLRHFGDSGNIMTTISAALPPIPLIASAVIGARRFNFDICVDHVSFDGETHEFANDYYCHLLDLYLTGHFGKAPPHPAWMCHKHRHLA